MNGEDFLKFIEQVQTINLNPVQKKLLENMDTVDELKLRMVLPRQSSYVQITRLLRELRERASHNGRQRHTEKREGTARTGKP